MFNGMTSYFKAPRTAPLGTSSSVGEFQVSCALYIGALAQHGGPPWHTVAQCGRNNMSLFLLCGCGWYTTDTQVGVSSTGMPDMVGCDTTCLLSPRSELNGAVVSAVVVVAGWSDARGYRTDQYRCLTACNGPSAASCFVRAVQPLRVF